MSMVQSILSAIRGRRIAVLCASVLLISPLFRFSWDVGPQALLHVVLFVTAVFVVNRYEFRPFIAGGRFFILFLGAATLSAVGTSNLGVVRNELLVLIDGMIIAWLVSLLPAGQRKELLVVPVVAGVWVTIIVILRSVMAPQASLVMLLYAPVDQLFVNPNIVAGYLTLCFPLSFILWNRDRTLGAIVSGLLVTSIVLTRSRPAMTIAFVVAAILLMRSRRRHGTMLHLLFPAFLVLIAYVTYIKADFGHSITDRLVWWKTAIGIFLSHPLTGIGWGNYDAFFHAYRDSLTLNSLYVHNLPLQLLAESGIVGLLTMIALVAAWFWENRQSDDDEESDAVTLYVQLSVAGFLFLNLFDYSFYIAAPQLLFWACMGALLPRTARKRARPLLPRPFILGSAAAAAFLVTVPLRASIHFQKGVYYRTNGALKASAAEFSRAAAIDPLMPVYYQKAAEVDFQMYRETKSPGFLEASIVMQRTSLARHPVDARGWSDLCWLYLVKGDRENAEVALRRASECDRANPKYRVTIDEMSSMLPQEP